MLRLAPIQKISGVVAFQKRRVPPPPY
jgi:hypothetical protein